MKKIKVLAMAFAAVLLMVSLGCGGREVRRIAPPVAPSLAERLDELYRNAPMQWESTMRQLIASEDPQIPQRHLVAAIKEFNDVKTQRECLGAAFLYLDKEASASRSFAPDDRQLFTTYVEYVLKHPDNSSMNNVKSLCRKVQDGICQGLR